MGNNSSVKRAAKDAEELIVDLNARADNRAIAKEVKERNEKINQFLSLFVHHLEDTRNVITSLNKL